MTTLGLYVASLVPAVLQFGVAGTRIMNPCAYCGRLDHHAKQTRIGQKLTKEHVYPAFIIEAETSEYRTALYDKGIEMAPPPVIRDVCNHCNNGVLAELDGRIKATSWEDFNSVVTTDTKVFHYDFDLLCRWLLKVSYNSARVADTKKAYEKYTSELVAYILGLRPKPEELTLCAHVIKNTPSPFQAPGNSTKMDVNYKHGVRVSDISFNQATPELQLSRMVSINNYYFYLFYRDSGFFRANLPQQHYCVLEPHNSVVNLPSGRYDFWQDSVITGIRNKHKRDGLNRK